jgi:DNA-binding transcriptional regulator YhcF (GntR family)
MAQWQRLSTIDQFTAHLRTGLLAGQWADTMPGVHRLAAEFGLNRKTVEAALQRLEAEGLLAGQGAGRQRMIVLPEDNTPPALRVAVLPFEIAARNEDYMIELRHQLELAGHTVLHPDKTLIELGQDAARVAHFAKKIEADAWVVCCATAEVLEWFSSQETPTFALFGRMEEGGASGHEAGQGGHSSRRHTLPTRPRASPDLVFVSPPTPPSAARQSAARHPCRA